MQCPHNTLEINSMFVELREIEDGSRCYALDTISCALLESAIRPAIRPQSSRSHSAEGSRVESG